MARLINQSMRPVISLDARYLHLLHGIGSIKLIFHHRLEPNHLALVWTALRCAGGVGVGDVLGNDLHPHLLGLNRRSGAVGSGK